MEDMTEVIEILLTDNDTIVKPKIVHIGCLMTVLTWLVQCSFDIFNDGFPLSTLRIASEQLVRNVAPVQIKQPPFSS